MKIKLTILAAIAVAAVALTASAPAQPTAASNYSCTYRLTAAAVYIRLYGYDNLASYCKKYSKGWGRRVYLGAFPTKRCTFQSAYGRVYISVYSKGGVLARYARYVCSKFEKGLADAGWVRL